MFDHKVYGRIRLTALVSVVLLMIALAAPGFAAQPGGPGAPGDETGGTAQANVPNYALQGDATNNGTGQTTFNSTFGTVGGGNAAWFFNTSATESGAVTLRSICGSANCWAIRAFSTASGSNGINAEVTSATGIAIYGEHSATTGTTAGVQGANLSTSGNAEGVLGIISSTTPGGFSAGVRAINNGTGGNGIGVWGSHAGTGWGVYGATSGAGRGVYGNSPGTGVYGIGTGAGAGTYGVYGTTGSTSQDAVGVYGVATTGNARGVVGNSANGIALLGASTNGSGFYGFSQNGPGGVLASGSATGVTAYSNNPAGWAIVTGGGGGAYGNVYIGGNYQATGTKSARVETNQGDRLLYATESTKNIFSDQGSAQLVNGRAVITLDPLYAQTVNLNESYQVFVTPNSANTLGLAVVNKTATSFEVRELNNGTGAFSFDWRIDALRKGYEKDRLEPAAPAPGAPPPPPALPAPPADNAQGGPTK